jgi:glyoxalase family protein
MLSFSDPEGRRPELVATADTRSNNAWKDCPVPEVHAVRGLFGVTLSEKTLDPTASLLTETLGFQLLEKQGGRSRFTIGSEGPSTFGDVLSLPDALSGEVSVGTVHHLAWRTPDDEQQKSWREIEQALPKVRLPAIAGVQ